MSLSEQGRNDVVLYRLEKAQFTMEQIRAILPMQYWGLIANRLYYAAYYAVSALLIAHGHRIKSHEGTIQQFGLHFANKGIVPHEMGRFYRQLFSLRLTGDYEDNYDITEDQVLPVIEPTEQLIATVSNLVRQALAQTTIES